MDTGNPDVRQLWREFEAGFQAAFEALERPDHFRVYACPAASQPWRASRGEEPEDIESTAEVRQAGEALLRLAAALPLVNDETAREALIAEISDYDGSLWIDVTSLYDKASAKLLIDAETAEQFAQCRNFSDDDSDWARAARTRCVRKTVFGSFDVIEPGVVWFIEWLERHGAKTMFSCEGHPHDFHVIFKGPYPLAHALAGVAHLTVSVFRSKGYPQTGQWRMELDWWPGTRAERDQALRALAEELSRLTVPASLGQRIRQILPFPV